MHRYGLHAYILSEFNACVGVVDLVLTHDDSSRTIFGACSRSRSRRRRKTLCNTKLDALSYSVVRWALESVTARGMARLLLLSPDAPFVPFGAKKLVCYEVAIDAKIVKKKTRSIISLDYITLCNIYTIRHTR